MTPTTLARYRLRPVPLGRLAALAGWALVTRLLVELPTDPDKGVTMLRWAGTWLGLGGAVLAAPRPTRPAPSCGPSRCRSGAPWPCAWPAG